MEVEILKEALDLARVKKPTLLSRSSLPEDSALPPYHTTRPWLASGHDLVGAESKFGQHRVGLLAEFRRTRCGSCLACATGGNRSNAENSPSIGQDHLGSATVFALDFEFRETEVMIVLAAFEQGLSGFPVLIGNCCACSPCESACRHRRKCVKPRHGALIH
jgi:hypothetical protein